MLAGGQSSRMGADKAMIEFRGQPLVVHMVRILSDAGLPAAIAGARQEARANMSSFVPVINDVDSGQGPLAGICSALAVTPLTWAVFVPIDLPLLPPQLVITLLDHAQLTGRPITLTSLNGFTQTFPCVLNRAVLAGLREELDAGRNGCFSAFQAAARKMGQALGVVPVEQLAQTGQVRHGEGLPATRWFFNFNSPADLECAGVFRPRPDRAIHAHRVS